MAAGRLIAPLMIPLLLAAAPVVAQTAAPSAAPSAPGLHVNRGPSPERREEWRAKMQAHEAQEAADVALLLRLRPDQQAGFQAWMASMKPPEGEREGWRRDEPAAGGVQTTPQELDRMQAAMAEHEARARAHLDATRRFYAALSPEQQALFDALMRLDHHGRGMHGGERGEGAHGGEGRPPMGGPPPGA